MLWLFLLSVSVFTVSPVPLNFVIWCLYLNDRFWNEHYDDATFVDESSLS